jgi:hypothetical protein
MKFHTQSTFFKRFWKFISNSLTFSEIFTPTPAVALYVRSGRDLDVENVFYDFEFLLYQIFPSAL